MRWLKLLPFVFVGACAAPLAPPPQPLPAEPVATAPVLAEPVPVQEEVAPLPAPEPARLIGLNPRQVQALVGEPSLVRRDGHVQVMLYEAPTCVFEIVFYEANSDAHFLADSMSARSRSGIDVDLQTCLIDQLAGGQWIKTQNSGH